MSQILAKEFEGALWVLASDYQAAIAALHATRPLLEPVAWLKEWDSVGKARTGLRRVDLTEECEPWLANMFPKITPLYAAPPNAAAQIAELTELLVQALPYVEEGEEFNKPTRRGLSKKIRASVKQGQNINQREKEMNSKPIQIQHENTRCTYDHLNMQPAAEQTARELLDEVRSTIQIMLQAERGTSRPPVTVMDAELKLDMIRKAASAAEDMLAKIDAFKRENP